LMKGILAGKIDRSKLHERDSRNKYPQYQGDEWEKNMQLVDKLRAIAGEVGRSVAQVSLNWILRQPGITSALCGARRPDQIRDNALASDWELTAEQLAFIEQALKDRGAAKIYPPV
jgi:aryl-alcohol dehydrogenase-like predicted oxidoreductase